MYELTNETVAGRKYYARLELLDDWTVLTNYGDNAVGITSISLSQTLCGSESVSIGCVNAACATIVLETGTALENQRFALYLGQEFDGAVEWVPMGIFTGTKAEFSEGRLTVEAWDDLYFAGGAYTPSDSMTGECTVATALNDVCNQLGIQFLQSSVPEDVTIAGMPTGLTCSAAIGHLAALCGASACMDRDGYLAFRQFTESGQVLGADDCYSGGMVFKTSDFTVASLTNTLEAETTGDDGETTTETTEVERTTGAAGGCIALTNPIMTEDNIDTAWDAVKGFTYRPATLTAVGQIAVDVGDVLTVTDADGAVYSVPVMTHTLEYDGGLKSTITAAGESESQQSAAVSGPVAQQIKELTTKVTDTKVLASGKNAVYYAAAAPSAEDYTLSVNDLWFDTSGGDYAMYYWDGSKWVAAPFGTDALGDGIITASKIVTGAVTAEKLNVAELSAITANLGTVTAGDISGVTISGSKFVSVSLGYDGSVCIEAGTAEFLGDTLYDTSGSTVKKGNGGIAYRSVDGCGHDTGFPGRIYISDGDIILNSYGVGEYGGYNGLVRLTSSGIHVCSPEYSYDEDDEGTEYICDYGAVDWMTINTPSKSVTIDGTLTINGFRVPEIQHGSISVTVAKETNTEFSVTFDQAFSGTPTITLTPAHAYADASGVGLKILSSSSTGFTGCLYDNGGRTIWVKWIAVY